MYESFFDLQSRPFASALNVSSYFPASSAEASLQSLIRGVEQADGPGVLIGAAGLGKSLLFQLLAERFEKRFHVVLLDCVSLRASRDLLQSILFHLHLPYRGMEEGELRLSLLDFLEPNEEARQGLLLLMDEAHKLPLRLLEELRMMTNLVRNGQPRVRLALAGAERLEEHLGHPRLESFQQRIAVRSYLAPLGYEETRDYIVARLKAVGGEEKLFAESSWAEIHRISGGAPRLVNQICDQALLTAAVGRRSQVDASCVRQAWAELQQLPAAPSLAAPSSTAPPADDTVVEFGSLSPEGDDLFTSSPSFAPLAPAELHVVREGVETGIGDIRIAIGVPLGIEDFGDSRCCVGHSDRRRWRSEMSWLRAR